MKIELYQKTATGFERIATTYKASDIDFCETLFETGEFNLRIPLEASYTELFQKDVILLIDGDFWGVVSYTKRTADEGGTMLEISGIDLKNHILKKRCVVPIDYTTIDGTAGYDVAAGSTEAVIKHFWENNITAPPTGARKMNLISIAPNQNRGIADDKYMARGNPLDELTSEVCEAANLGYTASIIENNVVLDVLAGVDRTAEQSANARAIFEISRKNIANLAHEINAEEYKNTFYTVRSGAEFVDEALTMTYYRDDISVSDWERSETWIEVSAETPIAGQEYEELKYQATKVMDDFTIQESFTCEVTPNSRYKELWNVGDFVTVRWREQNITMDTQVTAVTTNVSGNEKTLIAKFGNSEPKYIGVKNSSKIIKI